MVKKAGLLVTLLLAPVVVVESWMFWRYGTLSPCAALDQIVIDRMTAENPPKSAGEYLAVAMVPTLRQGMVATPGRCLQAFVANEAEELRLAWMYRTHAAH